LEILDVSNNADMSGALPKELTALRLHTFGLAGTGICVPRDGGFREWLLSILNAFARLCPPGSAAAHLTQATQSLDYPVSLVAGEDALLRVFVTADNAPGARIPPMRATFFESGRETYVADVPGQTTTIPAEIDEGDLEASANVTIPGSVLVPGLEMVVEVDPDGTLGAAADVPKRIPETGRLGVGVRAVPRFDLVVVPFLRRANPDRSIIDIVNALTPDDELFEMTRTLLPVQEMELTAHEPVWTSSEYASGMLAELRLLRAAEGGTGYYLGTTLPVVGGGLASPFTTISDLEDWVVAHELGHTFSLAHAPCGNPLGVDPAYPYSDGSIGAWGYDRENRRLVSPHTPDLMSYCGGGWISEYHLANAMRHRVDTEQAAGDWTPTRALLVWGGLDAGGQPYLEPSFIADALPGLPPAGNDYLLRGTTEDGREAFSYRFDMPVTLDVDDGRSGFVFAIPITWDGTISRIRLSGAEDSFVLDGDTDLPMTILRDPVTGQIRAILRRPVAQAMDAVGEPNFAVLFSRGIPE